MCPLRRSPGATLASTEASVVLRTSDGSRRKSSALSLTGLKPDDHVIVLRLDALVDRERNRRRRVDGDAT
jgi:hypothetical protein